MLEMKNSLINKFTRRANPIIDYWSPCTHKSFQKPKEAIAEAVLILPSPNEELILRTDASNACIAAVLQTWNGKPVFIIAGTY